MFYMSIKNIYDVKIDWNLTKKTSDQYANTLCGFLLKRCTLEIFECRRCSNFSLDLYTMSSYTFLCFTVSTQLAFTLVSLDMKLEYQIYRSSIGSQLYIVYYLKMFNPKTRKHSFHVKSDWIIDIDYIHIS